MRDFFEILHVTCDKCTPCKKSCGSNKAVCKLQTVCTTDIAGYAGNLGNGRDKRNGLKMAFSVSLSSSVKLGKENSSASVTVET